MELSPRMFYYRNGNLRDGPILIPDLMISCCQTGRGLGQNWGLVKLGERAVKFFAAICLMLIGACVSAPVATPAQSQQSASYGAAKLADYRLGPADKIRLIVYGEADLSGEFAINTRGQISLPLLGEVDAAGLTIDELRGNISQALAAGYLNDARVAAEIVEYRPYYILGEVGLPGEYPYSAGITVMKAVAAAQGFTYRAKKSSVYIKRADSDAEISVSLTQSLLVFPGDVVRIGERFF